MTITLPNPRRWWALALLSLAQFIVILDTSIVGVALPAIQKAMELPQRFGEGVSQLSALNGGFHAAFIGAALVAAGGALLTLTWL